jgi:hypothetical protein
MDPRYGVAAMTLSNSALEQPAATSRSWHRRQKAVTARSARQERSAPPLLTASVIWMATTLSSR